MESNNKPKSQYQKYDLFVAQNDKKFRFNCHFEGKDFDLSKSILSALFNEDFFEKDLETKDGWYKIYLVIHSAKGILSGQALKKDAVYKFAQDLLEDKENEKICPIIHITLVNTFVPSLYDGIPLPTSVPRSIQIIDSSIWNYLVPFTQKKNNEGKLETKELQLLFYQAVDSIYKNYKKGLYFLDVAKEYADLNARLIGESFLASSHANGVSPFIFHSENVTKRMIEKEFKADAQTIERIKKRKWRILLVDDKAAARMDAARMDAAPEAAACMDDETEHKKQLPWNCKLTIIKQLMDKQFGYIDEKYEQDKSLNDGPIPSRRYDSDSITITNEKREELKEESKARPVKDSTSFVIEYAKTLGEAKEALKNKKYDLVLLDYLLKEEGKENRYGYELLEDISSHAKDDEYKNGLGPNGKFFFLFISAYYSAVYERLLAEGLNQTEDYWHIAIGACPVNTPQLFLYNLIKSMEYRLDHAHINELSAKKIYELVESIYGSENVRKEATNKYEKVQSLQYHYRKMLRDVDVHKIKNVFDTKGSVLITDFIKKNVNLGGMLEHLNHLVHLTAFGTIRQWPEMWEEYIYFKGQFKAQNDNAYEDKITEREYNTMTSYIEEYIKKLKED